MKFELPELPYAYSAMEPAIDSATMETHHGKHHATYTNNLNNLLEEHEVDPNQTIEELLAHISTYPVGILNNAGGFYNHNLYWQCITPGGSEMSESLTARLVESFGHMETFLSEFEHAAMTQFGSGWAWLSISESGELKISATSNQDNPLMDTVIKREGKFIPVLCLDVWEHAYYLQYKNRRADYIKAWWSVVDWVAVEERINQVIG